MMLRLIKRTFYLFMAIITLFVYMVDPFVVEASSANTLGELRDELAALEKQKKDNSNTVNSTNDQIDANRVDIQNSYDAIEKSKEDIIIAQSKIDESNIEIAELTDIVAELVVVYEQITDQESYLEYITGASSMADLIMRSDAVNQLLDYSSSSIENLENLIKENEQNKIDLENYQVTLNENIASYETKINSLESELQYYAEITEDIDDQIKNQEAFIEYYEDLGCEEDQDLNECVEIANNRGWIKPLSYAYVSSPWGMRNGSLHNGIDLAGNPEGTPVYAAAAGTVAGVTNRSSCGGNKVYVHVYVDGVAYTNTYIHLLEIDVKVGQKVTIDTQIGTVGGGSKTQSYDKCSTGAHLHFGVSKGFYLYDYTSYTSLVNYSIAPPGFPDKYGKFYSRTQWFD